MAKNISILRVIIWAGIGLILPTHSFALSINGINANGLLNRNVINADVPIIVQPEDPTDSDPIDDSANENTSNSNINSNTNQVITIPDIELPNSNEIQESIEDDTNEPSPLKKRLRNKNSNSISKPVETSTGENVNDEDIINPAANDDGIFSKSSSDQTAKTPDQQNINSPKFKRSPGERLPITLERYQDFLVERSNRAEKTTILSNTSKDHLKKSIEEERIWLTDKVEELQQSENIEARKAIQQEIQAYIQERRRERRQLVEKNISLPKTDALIKARTLTSSFEKIASQFNRVGIDTTSIESALDEYTTAIQEAQDIQDRLSTDPTLEDIQALRAKIATIHEVSYTLRNHIQTILVEENN